MKRIGKLIVTAMGMWLGVAAAAGKVQVTGTVDRNEMGVGDTFTYTIAVTSDSSLTVGDPRLPDIKGLELVNSWTGSESRSTFSNGTFQVEQSKTFSYMLATTQKGKITIGPAQVVVDGKAYNTQPITLNVLDVGQAPKVRPRAQNQPPGDDFDSMEDLFNQLLQRRSGRGRQAGPPPNPEEAFFIQAEVDKTKAYVGEQVTATWYIYTRGQIHDIDTLKYPSLNGFWKEEIELATRLNFQQEVVNGIVYQKALLASYALFPIKAGPIAVDAYKAKCTVSVPSNLGFSRPYQFTKSSRPVTIEVSDLPKENRPADYTGAVGKFQVSAKISQATVPTNQPMSLKLRYEGRGNAKLIDLPPLNLPPSFELYDTKKEAKFFKEGTSYKEFELLLIPREAGAFTLPAISVSAFDPESGKFYTVSTQPVAVNVTPGGPQSAIPSSPMAKQDEAPAQPKEPQLPGLITDWEAVTQLHPLQKFAVWSGVYLLIGLFLLWRVLVEFALLGRKKDLGKLFQQRLKVLHQRLDKSDWRGVGVEGTNLVYFVLGEICGEGGANLELEKLMLKAPPSVRRELAEPLGKLLQALQLLSFAPEGLVGTLKEKKELKRLVSELEKVLARSIKLGSREEPEQSGEPEPGIPAT